MKIILKDGRELRIVHNTFVEIATAPDGKKFEACIGKPDIRIKDVKEIR